MKKRNLSTTCKEQEQKLAIFLQCIPPVDGWLNVAQTKIHQQLLAHANSRCLLEEIRVKEAAVTEAVQNTSNWVNDSDKPFAGSGELSDLQTHVLKHKIRDDLDLELQATLIKSSTLLGQLMEKYSQFMENVDPTAGTGTAPQPPVTETSQVVRLDLAPEVSDSPFVAGEVPRLPYSE